MLVFLPVSLEEAFDAFEQRPDAQLLAGGTDFMVEVNYADRRPPAVVCLHNVAELGGWRRDGAEVVLGAGMTFTQLMDPHLRDLLPGLARASRTVGPHRFATWARWEATSARRHRPATRSRCSPRSMPRSWWHPEQGRRSVRLDEHRRPKRTTLAPGEIIVEIRVPAFMGSQEFLKVGTRNTMVIAVANLRTASTGSGTRSGARSARSGPW